MSGLVVLKEGEKVVVPFPEFGEAFDILDGAKAQGEIAEPFRVIWPATCSQERSAKVGVLAWHSTGRTEVVAKGRHAGKRCLLVWPEDFRISARWVPLWGFA